MRVTDVATQSHLSFLQCCIMVYVSAVLYGTYFVSEVEGVSARYTFSKCSSCKTVSLHDCKPCWCVIRFRKPR